MAHSSAADNYNACLQDAKIGMLEHTSEEGCGGRGSGEAQAARYTEESALTERPEMAMPARALISRGPTGRPILADRGPHHRIAGRHKQARRRRHSIAE
jgi:hypothetical protein